MPELSRRRALAALNSRYIYGRVPLLHALIFLLEIIALMSLVSKFNYFYNTRPVLTTMIINAILGGIADTAAQSITAIRRRSKLLPTSQPNTPVSFLTVEAVEMNDLSEKPKQLSPLRSMSSPPPFDFERLTRFAAYGFLMAPVQHAWFQALSLWFPVTKSRGLLPALQRVAMDQLIFAPISLSIFFTVMTLAEGGGRRAVISKFQDLYVPTLRANYLLWPAVQILNFRVMPIRFQIPFVSSVGIGWTAYLSITNSRGEE